MSQSGKMERVAVIGAGGIGGVVASRLAGTGHGVLLCVRSPFPRLVVGPAGAEKAVDVEISAEPGRAAPADWIFLTTKAQETSGAADWLKALCHDRSTIVVLQNGIDHEERVRPYVDGGTVLPAIVYIGAERVAPGHVVEHGGGRLIVPAGEAADRLSALFSATNISVETTADFLTDSWVKLLGNIYANPITALTMRRADVFGDPDILALARALVTEAVAVGRAAGARFAEDQAETVLAGASRLSKDSGSSMLYDRLAGRPLEHQYLTGAVVRTAARLGVDAPLNRAILALLSALSDGLAHGAAKSGQA